MKKIITFILLIFFFISCSTESDSNSNSTTTVVPLAPTNLIGNVDSSTIINLSWTDNSTNEMGFKIERRSGSDSYTIVGIVNQNVLSFSDSGLTPNTNYTYRVFAYNSVGSSLTYSNELSLTTFDNSNAINVQGPNIIDIDGNTYQSVTNCGLTFTKQNLNVSKYSDGTQIPQVTDATVWSNLTTGAWCYYSNNTSNGVTYGKLYNWYAIMGIYDSASAANPSLRKKLAPTGWHIPTDSEWSELVNCLGGALVAGGKMKSTGTSIWQSPNTGATNESGFSGLPGGNRSFNGQFGSYRGNGSWWSSSENTATDAFYRSLNYSHDNCGGGGFSKGGGFSVRCIKD